MLYICLIKVCVCAQQQIEVYGKFAVECAIFSPDVEYASPAER